MLTIDQSQISFGGDILGLMCSLGLVACITVGGNSYSESDFYDISYECGMASSEGYFSEVTFILVGGKYRAGRQQGYLALEMLEELGVEFRWKPKGKTPSQAALAKYRKNQLKAACYPF